MIIQRVEKHKIKQSNTYYPLIDSFCFNAKNLYNLANYLIRQEFVSNGNWLRHTDLDKTLRADIEYSDYKNMPTAQSAQQLLRLYNYMRYAENNKYYVSLIFINVLEHNNNVFRRFLL